MESGGPATDRASAPGERRAGKGTAAPSLGPLPYAVGTAAKAAKRTAPATYARASVKARNRPTGQARATLFPATCRRTLVAACACRVVFRLADERLPQVFRPVRALRLGRRAGDSRRRVTVYGVCPPDQFQRCRIEHRLACPAQPLPDLWPWLTTLRGENTRQAARQNGPEPPPSPEEWPDAG
ncbi:DUF6083 domain-containing protein [Streptomyces sp. NPDC049837]|uniref:DUF6083 domain-containing protein n=1 Tax=Streptomyces sp. NPDC049837 TaxID=3155277 RepID=UPI003423C030